MDIVLLLIRLLLAGVFGVAGLAKAMDRKGSEKALREFGMPASLVPAAAVFLPLAEIAVAVSLLFVTTSWYAAIASAALLGVFTAAMLYQMAKGRNPDCHCFGQVSSTPVSNSTVVRNVLLLVASAVLISRGASDQGTALVSGRDDAFAVVVGLVVLGLLFAAFQTLVQIVKKQDDIVRRIEVMELVAREGGEVERDEAGHPHEGLPIGAHIAGFEAKDIEGEKVTLDGLLSGGVPLLFLYVSPNCTPCAQLLPDIPEWQSRLDGRVRLVFISSGSKKENKDKFGDLSGTVILQEGREVSDVLKAKWTPTAVFVSADGRVISHPAAGDQAIRDLVEQIASGDAAGPYAYFVNGSRDSHLLRVGESAPHFAVKDITGRVINNDYIAGKRTLVAFWSTTCPHCENMLPSLREWDEKRTDEDPQLIVFSDGDEEAHKKFGLRSPVIIDPGHETAGEFGMYGTPSAVLLDEESRFITETAIGAPDIWALLGRRK
jgi:thiol-disulfide isomerase/thioredoxin